MGVRTVTRGLVGVMIAGSVLASMAVRGMRRDCTFDAFSSPPDLSVQAGRVVLILMSFEILHFAFVLLGCCSRLERAEVPTLPGLRVLLARIQSIPA